MTFPDADDEQATARSRTPQFPPSFGETSREAKTFVSLAASLPKVTKHQLSPRKLVLLPEAEGGDLCEADGSELATARFRLTPQLPPSFSETIHSAKTSFFLAAS